MPRFKVTGDGKGKAQRKPATAPAISRRVRAKAAAAPPKRTAADIAASIKGMKAKDAGKKDGGFCLKKATLAFLRGLKANNTREWFASEKDAYEEARADIEKLTEKSIRIVARLDPALSVLQAKSCMHRIHRDVRFSGGAADPYKTYLSAVFSRSGKKGNHACYYLHIEPDGSSMVGGGMWCPPAPVIGKLRENLAANPDALRQMLAEPQFVKMFGKEPLAGDESQVLKTAPKGFSRDHEAIDLLRHKSFIVSRKLTDAELTSPGLMDIIDEACTVMTPFLNLLNSLAGL